MLNTLEFLNTSKFYSLFGSSIFRVRRIESALSCLQIYTLQKMERFDICFFFIAKNLSFLDLKYSTDMNVLTNKCNVNKVLDLYVILTSFITRVPVVYRKIVNILEVTPTFSFLYRGADWLEREIYDMFGLRFSGRYSIRRILTDYGFRGFPLTKEYPVLGYTELMYSYENRQVIHSPVFLSQNWRIYINHISHWQN